MGGWGDGRGVGWGRIKTSLARPHIRDATLLYVLLHFIHIHTYVMLCCCRISCTSTHTSCYTAVGSLDDDDDDDGGDDGKNDDGDDDDDGIAYGTRVSFLSLLDSPI